MCIKVGRRLKVKFHAMPFIALKYSVICEFLYAGCRACVPEIGHYVMEVLINMAIRKHARNRACPVGRM